MKKFTVLFAILANLVLFLACSQDGPTKEQMIGTWKHPIAVGSTSINTNNDTSDTPVYNYEIFKFFGDGTFVFGEYSSTSALYEVNGRWELSNDNNSLTFSFDDGQTSSIDIRDFKGNSFTTTSRNGMDFVYTKE